jgi:hypothetical protein
MEWTVKSVHCTRVCVGNGPIPIALEISLVMDQSRIGSDRKRENSKVGDRVKILLSECLTSALVANQKLYKELWMYVK